jgi:universal stress protein E
MRLLTLKTILVATDLDRPSQAALRSAARLSHLAGAHLHLLHVSEHPHAGDEARLRAHFESAAPDAERPETARVISGSPAEEIVEHAARLDADVVIMGPHRRDESAGRMGSTAARVVRTSSSPCLVAATELRLPLTHVLAPVDLSEGTAGTLSVALSWASALRSPGAAARLTALYVTTDASSSDSVESMRAQVEKARTRAGRAARVEMRDQVTSSPDPLPEAILKQAEAEATDLIVMGTMRSESAAGGLGSVSAAVAEATPYPLLLVPPTYQGSGDG